MFIGGGSGSASRSRPHPQPPSTLSHPQRPPLDNPSPRHSLPSTIPSCPQPCAFSKPLLPQPPSLDNSLPCTTPCSQQLPPTAPSLPQPAAAERGFCEFFRFLGCLEFKNLVYCIVLIGSASQPASQPTSQPANQPASQPASFASSHAASHGLEGFKFSLLQ